jgi:hypothetical protein
LNQYKLMHSKKNTVTIYGSGGKTASGSAMGALQALKHVTSFEPRPLTKSEIALLRRAKSEIGRRVRELAHG